jgi:predicted dehydrogenase
MRPIRLLTLAPGHFHAALVQKEMTPGIATRSYVYAPLDADTSAHLARIANFNTRAANPTTWELDLRLGANWRERFQREQPGNTVVLSGRNRPKIDLMRFAIAQGLHVLADKPWIIDWSDFPKLEELFQDASLREVLVWDVMTERHEVTNRLQRELVRDQNIFGFWQVGSPRQPALVLESVHRLRKTVAGRPLIRPWWWFDAAIAGEAIADVGTHLADLALWFIAPDQAVDYRCEIQHLTAESWPLVLSEEQFQAVTGLPGYPTELSERLVNGQLYYAGNNTATFMLRGVHVQLTTLWDYQSVAGVDTHNSVALGTKAKVAVRQHANGQPEVFIVANERANHAELVRLLLLKCQALQFPFPGLAVADHGSEAQLLIPDELRTGHESHFGEVMQEFARYFDCPRAVPAWEQPNTLAKYFITTKAVELARR